MVRIGLCQFTSALEPGANLEAIREWTGKAAAAGASVVVFPEAAMARFGAPLAQVAEPLDGPWAQGVARVAAEHGVLIVAGMFTPGADDRVRNTLLLTGRGTHRGYDKIHLYDAFGFLESDTVEAGTEPVTVAVDGVTLGVATCYDVRFPELFRAHADAGAAAVLLPTSWGAGEGKREQWELLVRARALDAGIWVLGCDQADPAAAGTSAHPKAPTGIGYSLVADPFGRAVDQLDDAPGLLLTDVDPEVAERSRAATAVLANRKL